MSLQHLYLDNQVLSEENEETFELRVSADDMRHLKVLRVAVGEHVAVVDSAKDYFECEFVELGSRLPVVRICRHLDAPDRPDVVLVQGLAKGDKMETIIRHATELGVSAFLPLASSRCVMKIDPKKQGRKLERWRSIARSAAQQSGQPFVPEVLEPMSVAQSAKALSGATCVLVCWEEAPTSKTLRKAIDRGLKVNTTLAADARVAVVVGPEGGLSADEVNAFLGANPCASLVSLGSSILRTETAGIVAPALVLHELGYMG